MIARMKQAQTTLSISNQGRGMTNITRQIQSWIADTGIQTGQVTVFVQHTSCSLMIQENADPDVLTDMEMFMNKLIQDGDPDFLHRDEGDDDMSAHIRMALTNVSLNIPVSQGRAALGIWQAVYLYEHRYMPMRRHVLLHIVGE
jgi:secondary thiamine-phosphate synthase enzyme